MQQKKLDIFPYALIRICGRPLSRFAKLNLEKASLAAEQIYQLEQELNFIKEKISDELYKLIGKQTNSQAKVKLINLKRDIFNKRQISSGLYKKTRPLLSSKSGNYLKKYLTLQKQIKQKLVQAETLFNKEIQRSEELLLKLIKDKAFLNGLILSSPSLLANIEKKAPNSVNDAKLVKGTTKYLARMYTKPTPFSTFTNLSIGKITDTSTKFLTCPKKILTKSHVRLNNAIFKYLSGLLIKNPKINQELCLQPNPTLKKENNRYIFLTNCDNKESFQRIKTTPALNLVLTLMKKAKNAQTRKELTAKILAKKGLKATPFQLQKFIDQLLEYGFLEYDLGVSGTDPDWDKKLHTKLKPLIDRSTIIKDVIDTLNDLHNLSRSYAKSGFAKRKKITEQAYNELKNLCLKLHKAANLPKEELQSFKNPEKYLQEKRQKRQRKKKKKIFKHKIETDFLFKQKNMFYEDVTAEISPALDGKKIKLIAENLHPFLSQLEIFDAHSDERDKMLYFYKKKYGKKTSINLLTFYEDYYREFKKTKKFKSANIESIKKRQKKLKKWRKIFIANLERQMKPQKKDEVKITLNDLKKANKAIINKIQNNNNNANNAPNSYCAFLQFYKSVAVLNNTTVGFGKMYSRFLHLFDDKITTAIQKKNKQTYPDTLLAENTDASFFNANLHPPLIPFEVKVPGGNNRLPQQQQIPITKIQVNLDKTAQKLCLTEKNSQKRVYIFDLDFQGIQGRSELYRLLHNFSLTKCIPYRQIIEEINNKYKTKKENKTIQKPRIIYENKIILQRKSWTIPASSLPLRKKEENNWEYFYRIHFWRLKHKIPQEVFVYITDLSEIGKLKPKEREKYGADDYKPQYINFGNYFLIDLLNRQMQKVKKTLTIQEMLPDSKELLSFGKEKYVSEFLIQWYYEPAK